MAAAPASGSTGTAKTAAVRAAANTKSAPTAKTPAKAARSKPQPKKKTAAKALARSRRGSSLDATGPSYDVALAAQGFKAVEPRLRKIARGAVEIPNANIPAVITRLLEIGAKVEQPAERARFAAMPEIDQSYVDLLSQAAWALWYARVEYLAAGANASNALLPASLVEPATDTRARMLRVLEYHFANDSEVMAEILSIREGAGYLDLSMDLSRTARLYHQLKATLVHDKAHYRATDEALAITLAQKIASKLRKTEGAAAQWADMQARAWTFMRTVYEEVAAAGRYLHRYDEPMDKFPALNAMQPVTRTSRPPAPQAEPAPPAELPEA